MTAGSDNIATIHELGSYVDSHGMTRLDAAILQLELREIQRLLQCLIDKDSPPKSESQLTEGMKLCTICRRKYEVLKVEVNGKDEMVIAEVTTFDDRLILDAPLHECKACWVGIQDGS